MVMGPSREVWVLPWGQRRGSGRFLRRKTSFGSISPAVVGDTLSVLSLSSLICKIEISESASPKHWADYMRQWRQHAEQFRVCVNCPVGR